MVNRPPLQQDIRDMPASWNLIEVADKSLQERANGGGRDIQAKRGRTSNPWSRAPHQVSTKSETRNVRWYQGGNFVHK